MPGLISWTTDQSDSQKLHKTDNIHKLHNALTTYLDQINKPEKQNERDNERDNIVEMIQYTREINYHDSKGNTPLHLAVATQDLVIVAAVMARKPELQRTNTLGRTALHEAVARSNTKIVPLLLPAENSFLLDINPSQTHLLGQLDKSGITPIDIALIHDNPAMLKVLLNYKVNPVQSKIIIINALCYGAEKCFSLLLQYDCKLVSCSIKNDATPLHFACAYNLESCIDMIITSFHFDPEKHLDRQDGNGFTPIFMAARSGNRACMEKLIKAGARTDMLDYKRRSLIAVACYPCAKNSIRHSDELKNIVTDTVSTLIQSGVDTNVLMDGGQSCLHLVAQTDNVRLFKLLLNKGLDPSLQDKMGRTPLHYAADNGSASIIKLLLDTIANANMTDRDGLLPLHLACGLNNEVVEQKDINATIRHLLRKTDDPNRLSITNVTPLLLACRNGLTSNILEMLSSETHYKVNPNTPDSNGCTPIQELTAVIIHGKGNKDDYLEIMVILLKSGADANKFTPQGSTLLNECIAAGKTAAIKTILTHAKEIDVNLANSCNGKRPLVEACLKLAKPLETVRALLARKANPNLGNTSIEGNTESNELTALYALFSPDAAVKDSAEECLKTVQLLMEYKADPYPPCNKIQDKFFPTPLHKLVTIKIQHEALFWLIKHFPPSKELLTQRNIGGLTLAQLSHKNRPSLNILLTSQLDKITAEATASGSHL